MKKGRMSRYHITLKSSFDEPEREPGMDEAKSQSLAKDSDGKSIAQSRKSPNMGSNLSS